MPKIPCDPRRSSEEIKTIYERHEALGCHLREGIRAGIEAHNKQEVSLGFNRATPPEIERALAETILNILGPSDLDDFIELMKLAGTVEFLDTL